jgi:FkbM family methyltransferase
VRDSWAEQLEELLSENLDSVRDRQLRTFDRLLDEAGGKLVLFGAGSLGHTALRCLQRDGIRPLAIADNNSALHGMQIEGVPVVSRAQACEQFPDAAFVVTIWSTGHRYADTCDQLKAAGCARVYPPGALRWKYADDLLPYFLQDLPEKVYEEADQVRLAFELMGDDHSRKEFVAQVRYRALGDQYGVGAPDAEASYFLDSLYRLLDCEVFVDCGAYDGDTVREVVHRSREHFGRIVALEPDPRNLKEIERYLATLPGAVRARIEAYPYAASSVRAKLRFSANHEMGSAISNDGDIVVDAVPLDELLLDSPPTFVKMDIEGAEADALEGARLIVSRHRPLLSICVYHRQSDLWRIPLLIQSMQSGYRYYLRTHETDGWQTVLYAVPPERLGSHSGIPNLSAGTAESALTGPLQRTTPRAPAMEV